MMILALFMLALIYSDMINQKIKDLINQSMEDSIKPITAMEANEQNMMIEDVEMMIEDVEMMIEV